MNGHEVDRLGTGILVVMLLLIYSGILGLVGVQFGRNGLDQYRTRISEVQEQNNQLRFENDQLRREISARVVFL